MINQNTNFDEEYLKLNRLIFTKIPDKSQKDPSYYCNLIKISDEILKCPYDLNKYFFDLLTIYYNNCIKSLDNLNAWLNDYFIDYTHLINPELAQLNSELFLPSNNFLKTSKKYKYLLDYQKEKIVASLQKSKNNNSEEYLTLLDLINYLKYDSKDVPFKGDILIEFNKVCDKYKKINCLKIFKERFNEKLKDKNITQKQLSIKTGIPTTTISKLKKNNYKRLPDTNLSIIAQELGCTVSYLLGIVDECDKNMPGTLSLLIKIYSHKRKKFNYNLLKGMSESEWNDLFLNFSINNRNVIQPIQYTNDFEFAKLTCSKYLLYRRPNLLFLLALCLKEIDNNQLESLENMLESFLKINKLI